MVSVAVIWVALTTARLPTVMPLLLTINAAPATKLEPVKVTGTLAPGTPLAGLTDVSTGAGGFTVNTAALLVPPLVVTVRFAAPVAAVAATVSVAVIFVALTTVTLPAVTPGLLTATVAPATKLVPVRVTGTLAPSAPLAGLTEVSVGGGQCNSRAGQEDADQTPSRYAACEVIQTTGPSAHNGMELICQRSLAFRIENGGLP
jgi:hypothetical protein